MKKLSSLLLMHLAALALVLPVTSQAANNLFSPFSTNPFTTNPNDNSTEGTPNSNCQDPLKCLYAGYGIAMQGELTKEPVDAQTTIALATAHPEFFQPTFPKDDSTARAELKNFFTLPTTGSGTDYNWLYSFSPTIGSNCQNPQKTGFFSCSIKIENLVKNYNFNNYFGLLSYENRDQQTAAENFLQFSTMQNAPVAIADITQLITESAAYDKVLANNPDLQNYLGLLRLYAAIQSTAKSNLDYFYNQRLAFKRTDANGTTIEAKPEVKEALKNLPAPYNDPTQVSALKLENYMATRRLSKEWLLSLPKDNPIMLQRQAVILQAENLAETHRLRMSIDRLTATMSLIMMQNSYTMRQQISGEKDNLVAPQSDQSATSNP